MDYFSLRHRHFDSIKRLLGCLFIIWSFLSVGCEKNPEPSISDIQGTQMPAEDDFLYHDNPIWISGQIQNAKFLRGEYILPLTGKAHDIYAVHVLVNKVHSEPMNDIRVGNIFEAEILTEQISNLVDCEKKYCNFDEINSIGKVDAELIIQISLSGKYKISLSEPKDTPLFK